MSCDFWYSVDKADMDDPYDGITLDDVLSEEDREDYAEFIRWQRERTE